MKKLLCTTAIISVLSASAAFGADSDLLNQLQELKTQLKMQQEMISNLEKKLGAKIEKQEMDISKLKATPAAATVKGDVKISMTPSPKIESADGRYSFQPLGRIHFDTAVFDDDKTDHPDGATFRRARLGFKGTVDKDFAYKVELDFGNKSSTSSASFKDVYIAYTGFKNVNFRVGSFKPAYSMEEVISSNYTTFIENSLSTSFATGEIIGAQTYGGGKNFSWALGLHNDTTTSIDTDDEQKSVVGRVTFAPIAEKDKSLHFGVSGGYKVPGRDTDSADFSITAENALQTRKSAATGTISGVESLELLGLEAAGSYGPVALQTEYFHTSVNRENLADVDFKGWYAQASWLVTGETRPYDAKNGVFGRIKPNKPFKMAEDGFGAVEVAARYSNLDLNDGVVQGGEVDDITLGVNWYLNNNTRLMANYIMSNTDNVTPSGSNVAADDDPNVLLLRAAIDF